MKFITEFSDQFFGVFYKMLLIFLLFYVVRQNVLIEETLSYVRSESSSRAFFAEQDRDYNSKMFDLKLMRLERIIKIKNYCGGA